MCLRTEFHWEITNESGKKKKTVCALFLPVALASFGANLTFRVIVQHPGLCSHNRTWCLRFSPHFLVSAVLMAAVWMEHKNLFLLKFAGTYYLRSPGNYCRSEFTALSSGCGLCESSYICFLLPPPCCSSSVPSSFPSSSFSISFFIQLLNLNDPVGLAHISMLFVYGI